MCGTAGTMTIQPPDIGFIDNIAELRPSNRARRNELELRGGREVVHCRVFTPWPPQDKQARILDIGCGYGEFLDSLQKQGYDQSERLDLGRAHVEVAEQLGSADPSDSIYTAANLAGAHTD